MVYVVWALLSLISYKDSLCDEVVPLNAYQKNSVTIYSHGYGESGPMDTAYAVGDNYDKAKGPVYTDVTSFYTRPAVIKLTNYLHDQVKQGYPSIHLVGRSCGSGTIINALAKLVDYDNNVSYFNDSSITCKQDAEAILQAVNNGRLELTVPLLSIEKTAIVEKASKGLSGLSLMLGAVLATRGADRAIAVSLGALAAYYDFDRHLIPRYVWTALLDRAVIPCIFKHYDASHIKPIAALKRLKGKIACPILIQVCKHDGVLSNSPCDILTLYKALRKNNKQHTHIFVSDDAWHNSQSDSYIQFKQRAEKGKPMSLYALMKKLV